MESNQSSISTKHLRPVLVSRASAALPWKTCCSPHACSNQKAGLPTFWRGFCSNLGRTNDGKSGNIGCSECPSRSRMDAMNSPMDTLLKGTSAQSQEDSFGALRSFRLWPRSDEHFEPRPEPPESERDLSDLSASTAAQVLAKMRPSRVSRMQAHLLH